MALIHPLIFVMIPRDASRVFPHLCATFSECSSFATIQAENVPALLCPTENRRHQVSTFFDLHNSITFLCGLELLKLFKRITFHISAFESEVLRVAPLLWSVF